MFKKKDKGTDNTKQIEDIDSGKIWRRAVWISIAIWVGGAIITRIIGVYCFPSNSGNSESAGLFGDSFGAVNALVSALAFAGVIVTFYLQRHELKLQYKELKAQREEFTQQNKTLKLQRFENTFFHMMELQQQIVNDLSIQLQERVLVANTWIGLQKGKEVYVDGILRGRQVFAYIYWHKKQYGEPNGVLSLMHDEGIDAYTDTPDIELLDHYFRHLYTTLRYVDETDAFAMNEAGNRDAQYEWKQKYHYTTILRATLSRYELLVLYYNGLSAYGREKLKPLIEKFALLNNIDKKSLSISKEYNSLIPNVRPVDWAKKYEVIGTDFEYYLTEAQNDSTKYNICAFGYGEQEIINAKQIIYNFNKMIAERSK